jgi:hypothetical protein
MRRLYDSIEPLRLEAPPTEEPPTLPINLSNISGQDLANLCGAYGAWREYLCNKANECAIEIVLARTELEDYENDAYATATGKTIAQKEASYKSTDFYKALRKTKAELETYAEMIARKEKSLEASLYILSREITRRGS